MVILYIPSQRAMNQSHSAVEELLRRARRGDREALGELLEQHRAYLRILAERYIYGQLAARVDASDVIQQTCLSVYGNFDKFHGKEKAEFIAWLRRIHEQNIQNVVREHTLVQKRALGREQPRDDRQSESRQFPPADQTTASQRVLRDERAVQLARTLEKLPDDQREVVRLRHLEGWSLARIAGQLDRSEAATIGLLKRGMRNLRKYLLDDE